MAKVKSVVDTILGEATYGTPQQRYADMVNIASVIANRATQTRTTPQQVVSVRSEFNAYGKPLPSGAGSFRSLAQKAWEQVQASGPVHTATFYATPKAAKNLPKGLQQVASTSGHVYFADPQNRAIRTAVGFVKPVTNAVQQVAKQTVNTLGDVANAVTAPVRQVAAGAGNIASALRTAAFPSFSAPIAPSRPTVDVPGGYDLPSRPMADIGYRMGQKRPNPPSLDLVSRVQNAATDVLGPNVRVDVISGQGQYGSSRHRDPNGIAADVKIFDKATGQYVTNQKAMMDVAQAFAAQGGKGVGYGPEYMGNATMHLDTVTPGPGQDNEWGSLGNRNAGLLADARKSALMPASFYERNLPKSMPAPPSRSPVETMMAAPVGKVERAPLQAAAPRAPDPARFAYDTQPNPERFGPRTQTTTAKVDRLPSSAIPEPNPARFAYDVPATKAPTPERFGYGLVTPAAAATPQAPNANMSLADQYASYGAGRVPNPTPALNAMMSPNVGPLPQSFNPVAGSLMAPISPPTLQPPAPVPVTTPTMPRLPSPINQRIQQAVSAPPPSVPQYTAADVYAGRANSGVATGGNMVSRDQYGNTSVTNKYGVTTTTNANGQQMASSGPGIGGPLGSGGIGSVFDAQPDLNGRSKFGNTARQVGASMAGSAVGGLLGPIGSLLGAALAGELAKPGAGRVGDLLNGVRTMNINGQQMQFARPQTGGAFPNAPSGGFRDPTFSNRSDRSMRDISPNAARDIRSGTAGLF